MNWLWVARLFWRLSPVHVTAFVLVTVASAALPGVQIGLTAQAVQTVVDAVGGGAGITSAVLRIGLALLGLAVLVHLLSSWSQYLNELLRLELTAKVSELVMVKGTRMDLQQYEDSESYDKLQRAFQESNGGRVYQLMIELIDSIRDLVMLISVSAVLFSWNTWIAVLILAAPLPSVVTHLIYGRKTFEIEFERTPDRRRVHYFQYLATTDHSFKEVRLFGLGSYFLDRYRRLIRHFLAVDRNLARRQWLSAAALGLLSVLAGSVALILAMQNSVQTGQVGELAGYLQAVALVQTTALNLMLGISGLYQNSLFIGNLFNFLKLPERQIAGGDLPFPVPLRTGIEFCDVSFVYPGTTKVVLDRMSFTLEAGRCAAIVGPNGAGKTTIVKLLTRLYEPTSGEILIDGVPIQAYDLDDLHRHIGVIFQDFIRYELPVRNNIGFGRVESMDDDERVTQAAAAGGADVLIETLPSGYDTMLGRHFEEGQQLSGGQWQKIALSRAFMRRAPVVVLDEPTAAIDAEAEAEIFGRLREISAGATALLIAHRFSTVRIADKILVMERGRLTEEGTHTELLGAGRTYAHLFNLQAAGYLSETR